MQVVRKKFFKVGEAAEYTGLAVGTIRSFLRRGVLPGRKVGGTWLISIDALDEVCGVLK